MNNTLLPINFIGLISLTLSFHTFAFERDHDAHEHGHATMAIVIENNKVQLALHSPAMNILGFGHQAKTPEDKQKLEYAERQLKNTTQLFVFNTQANCTLANIHIESSLISHDENNQEAGHHSLHKEEHHAPNGDNYTQAQSENQNEAHSEFEVEYHFECKNITQLKLLNLNLFNMFPLMDEIDVQIISKTKQTLVELNKEQHQVNF